MRVASSSEIDSIHFLVSFGSTPEALLDIVADTPAVPLFSLGTNLLYKSFLVCEAIIPNFSRSATKSATSI